MATRKTKTPAAPTTEPTQWPQFAEINKIIEAAQIQPAPALHFVELDKIRALPQVRTEFDDQDLAELAASIQQQGILQPVLLRPDPDAAGTYIVIAGERRVRAAHLVGLTAVPALVGEVDESKAAEMQLVENIQREELSLPEIAAAVAQLYEKHQALKPIAALTGKSLPWVSKHLALNKRIGWRARMLLDGGHTEDLELVLTMSQIESLAWGRPQQELFDGIKEGKAGRPEARALLAEIREKINADKAKKKAEAKKAKKSTPRKAPEWDAGQGLDDLCDAANSREGFDVDEVLAKFNQEQQAAMLDVVRSGWNEGHQLVAASKLDAMRRLSGWMDQYPNSETLAAYILGANGIELTLRDLAIELRAIAQ